MADLSGVHHLIATELEAAGGAMTVPKLAAVLKREWPGIQSAVNGMVRRGEVVRLQGMPGKPWRYRLRRPS